MAITYHLSSTNSDLSGGADFNKKLLTSTSGAGTISVTIAASSTETSYAWTEPGVPGTAGTSTGSFTVEVNVTTAASNTTVRAFLTRVNSSGVSQAGPIAPAEAAAATTLGIKTFTYSNPALGTWASGDRLRVEYTFVNSHASQTRTPVIGTNTTSEDVATPFVNLLIVALTAGITPAGALGKRNYKPLTGGITPAGALVRGRILPRTYAGTLTTAGGVLWRLNLSRAGLLTFGKYGGVFAKRYYATRYFALRYFSHPTSVIAGALTKRNYRSLDGSITPGGAILKRIGKLVAGGITPGGALSVVKTGGTVLYAVLVGTLTTSGGLTKQINRSLAGTLTTAGALSKRIGRLLTGSLTTSGSIAREVYRAVTGALTPAGALLKRTNKVLTGGVTPAGGISVLKISGIVYVTIAGTLTTSGALVKRTSKLLTGAVTPGGALSKRVNRLLAGSLSTSGALVKRINRLLAGSLSTSGTITRRINRLLAGSLNTSGTLAKRISKSLAGVLSTAGGLVTSIIPSSGVTAGFFQRLLRRRTE